MSITFWFEGDKQIEEPYDCCAIPECPYCAGSGVAVVYYGKHEVNLTNDNAFTLLEVLGITPDYCGNIIGADLAQRAMVALNQVKALQGYAPSMQARQQGNVISFTLGVREIHERLQRLQKLGAAAGTNPVLWG